MDLAQAIIVRYKSDGHVRFQLPEALCNPPASAHLASEIHRIEGVYRVDLSTRQRKLSIRFIEHVCDFPTLGRELYRLISTGDWPEPVATPQRAALPTAVRKRLSAVQPIRWVRAKLQEARETVTALGIVARREAVRQRALSLANEDTVILFLNDALVLFLIKLHWHLITQHWIRQPWRYRYEWMAASYMIYLLVRSRRPKN